MRSSVLSILQQRQLQQEENGNRSVAGRALQGESQINLWSTLHMRVWVVNQLLFPGLARTAKGKGCGIGV